MALVNLTQGDIKKIQIDEGVAVANFGESDERIIGLIRGGVECTITPEIRDIEYDGRRGKTKGLQVKDSEDVEIKFNTICSSQENLALALVGKKQAESGDLSQGDFGLIADGDYLKNIAVVTQMLDKTYKILIVKNPMNESGFTFKPTPKGENEHALDMLGHYDATDSSAGIWEIKESATSPFTKS